jgi:hypothetical protein
MTMKKRPLLYIQGASYLLTAAFLLSLPFWAGGSDSDMTLFVVFFALALSFLAYRKFKQIGQTSEEEPAYDPAEFVAPPKDAIEEELATYYKRLLLALWLALLALTAIVVWDLNDLEIGTELCAAKRGADRAFAALLVLEWRFRLYPKVSPGPGSQDFHLILHPPLGYCFSGAG